MHKSLKCFLFVFVVKAQVSEDWMVRDSSWKNSCFLHWRLKMNWLIEKQTITLSRWWIDPVLRPSLSDCLAFACSVLNSLKKFKKVLCVKWFVGNWRYLLFTKYYSWFAFFFRKKPQNSLEYWTRSSLLNVSEYVFQLLATYMTLNITFEWLIILISWSRWTITAINKS